MMNETNPATLQAAWDDYYAGSATASEEADAVPDVLLTDRLLWLDVELEAREAPKITTDAMGQMLARTLGDAILRPDPAYRLTTSAVRLVRDIRESAIEAISTGGDPLDVSNLKYIPLADRNGFPGGA